MRNINYLILPAGIILIILSGFAWAEHDYRAEAYKIQSVFGQVVKPAKERTATG